MFTYTPRHKSYSRIMERTKQSACTVSKHARVVRHLITPQPHTTMAVKHCADRSLPKSAC